MQPINLNNIKIILISMNLIKDESGQAGGLIIVVAGIFLIGFFWVAFGSIMNQVEIVNNDLIDNSTVAYSQNHYDAADTIFQYWDLFALYAIIIFVIWGVKNALKREPGQI